MTQYRKRIRSPFNPHAIAEWMFDHGHGYVDEPHFELFDTLFYASDFLPEHREILTRKTQEAKAFYDIRRQQKDFPDAYLFPEHQPESPLFDHEQMQELMLDCESKAQAGLSDEMAKFEAAHALLQRISNGDNTIFSKQGIEKYKEKQRPHRQSFIRQMQYLPNDLLEYAARKELTFYLSTNFKHALHGYSESTFGINRARVVQDPPSRKPLHISRQIYTAGLNQNDPKQTTLIISHEIAHCIASAPLDESQLNETQITLFRSKLKPVQEILNRLKSEGDEQQWHMPLAQDSAATPAPVQKLIHALQIDPNDYTTEDQRTAELFCNMLALSYGYLEGDEGAAKLQAHYANQYPDVPELPNAIIELRDAVQSIFKQKLKELRETNPLPDNIGWQAGRAH